MTFGSSIHAQSIATSPSEKPTKIRIPPESRGGVSAAEYYSTDSTATLLIRVNIWGDVKQPGTYFLPKGVSVTDAVSSAGGPTPTAVLPEISVMRGSNTEKLDIFTAGRNHRLDEGDMVLVDQSFKTQLPLIYSTISAVASIVTLYFVVRDRAN